MEGQIWSFLISDYPPATVLWSLSEMKKLAELAVIPVIVLSARNLAGNQERALGAGAVAFFQKPADNHEFLTAIRNAMGETTALTTFPKT